MSNIEPIIDKAIKIIGSQSTSSDSTIKPDIPALLSNITSPFKYNMSLFNTNDKNTYVISLNNSANAMVFSLFVLFYLFFISFVCIWHHLFLFQLIQLRPSHKCLTH